MRREDLHGGTKEEESKDALDLIWSGVSLFVPDILHEVGDKNQGIRTRGEWERGEKRYSILEQAPSGKGTIQKKSQIQYTKYIRDRKERRIISENTQIYFTIKKVKSIIEYREETYKRSKRGIRKVKCNIS